MPLAPRRRLAAALASATVLVAGCLVPAAAAAPPPEEYVALGDSYSAGSGILPLAPDARPVCLQSTRNYPHLVADRIGADLTDVSCSGAETGDLYRNQHLFVPAQLDALTSKTDVVTLTIGGNDNSTFISAILKCGSLGALTVGFGSPCKNTYGSHFTDQVEQVTYPAVRQALLDIQERAPKAEVAIVGYPWIVPAEKGCFAKMSIAQGDIPYLRDLQATLNGVIEQAAAETGATFVDMAERSEGRDACAPYGERWIEPILFGTNVVPVHPNALGEAGMAEAVLATLGR
ncbi:SGNH/GDSL hydrolase family protein [Isoptericola sediminis]|uniref:SGNH/GDSL hydrolase family protein n=1 Tax=Isoptericola sediminis TaxID=2733572 RepID=A0A849KIA1_9MICO|nr:SGNH/GDSL hydrolase family protein [Isoptericola sediminis]NNU28373.1 SGNH/GDSL hydrolase family protein [Isoptericola sediminis]